MTERRYLQPHVRNRFGKAEPSPIAALQARYDRMGVEAQGIRAQADATENRIEKIRLLIWLYEFSLKREELAFEIDAMLAKHHKGA